MCSLLSWGLMSFVVQLLSCVQPFATPWTAAHQASLSFTISWSLVKLMSIKLVMPSNHLILCGPLLLSSIFLSIRVFPNKLVVRITWPKFWSFSFIISPSSEYSDTENYSLLLARILLWKQQSFPSDLQEWMGWVHQGPDICSECSTLREYKTTNIPEFILILNPSG